MTTKTTHTPGPWFAHNIWLGPEGKGPYAYPLGTDPDEAAANARLIAMAPRMLDALKTCVEMLEWWASVDGKAPEACYSPDGAWEKARAILRALDTPDAPCPVSPESKEPCPVCGPAKR